MVVLLFLGADLTGRSIAEDRIEERARAAAAEAGSVEADIESFPFLPPLLLGGSIRAVELRLEQVPTSALQLSAVEADLKGVKVDRDALFSGQAKLESVDRATLSVELDAASLSRALRVPVSIGDGAVRANLGRVTVRARPEVARDGSLVLRATRPVPLRVRVPRTRLVDCAPTHAAVVGQRVRLSCQMEHVPAVLRTR